MYINTYICGHILYLLRCTDTIDSFCLFAFLIAVTEHCLYVKCTYRHTIPNLCMHVTRYKMFITGLNGF